MMPKALKAYLEGLGEQYNRVIYSKDKFTELMHNQALKRKLYVIIFEADTPAGKLFDVTLIWCILLSVGLVILESLQGLPIWLKTPFIVMEYLLTAFFTFEYITRLYC